MSANRTRAALTGLVLGMLLAIGAAVLAVLATPEEARASFPGKNGLIGGEGEWSPDGTKVVTGGAGDSGPGINVKDVASGKTTYLDTPDYCDAYSCWSARGDLAWSPDGSKIVFVTYRDYGGEGSYYLAVINSDGSDYHYLDATNDDTITDPEWSPDGEHIAYRSWVEAGEFEIRVVDANGMGGTRRLYTQPTDSWLSDGAPEWSPDGKQVLFAASFFDNQGALWKVHSDGSNMTRLADTKASWGWHNGPASWYAWSPDGTKIAYEKDGEVWTMKPDGTAQTDTNTPMPTGVFDWQPLCTLKGTPNNDTLMGTSARDTVCGMGGNDSLKGLAGNDVLLGGDGNDTLIGGTGDDRVFGGLGTDAASYPPSATAVRASLIDEGATGEGTDTFMTIENLNGSAFSDELIGSSGANVLRGGKGNDVLRGRGFGDTLAGDTGADQHYGENGDDTLNSTDGVSGNDSLNGGPDTDTCFKDAKEKSVAYCEQ